MKKIRVRNKGIGRTAGVWAVILLAAVLVGIGFSACESPLLEEIRAASEPQSYTVTFDSQGANIPADPETMTVTSPDKSVGSLPTDPEKSDLTFGGWYTAIEGGGTGFVESTTVNADITVYAFWYDDSEVYEISFDTQGGIGGTIKVDAIYGQPMPFAEAPDPPADKSWLEFGGYYTSAKGLGDQYYDENMDSVQNWDRTTSTTLVAEWIYPIGDTGPAGGIVFYDKGSYTNGWRYLEAAPATTEWIKPWGGRGTLVGGTRTAIGSGAANTEAIVDRYGNNEPDEHRSDYAAKLCDDLVSGGKSDWFLPSKDELDEMYENLYRSGLGGFALDGYWSSSEDSADSAWAQDYSQYGFQIAVGKGVEAGVRAARAF